MSGHLNFDGAALAEQLGVTEKQFWDGVLTCLGAVLAEVVAIRLELPEETEVLA